MGLKNNSHILFKNRGLQGFTFLYIPFLIIGFVLAIFIQHGDVVLFINKYSRESWDGIVSLITDLGLGGFVAAVMGLLMFIRIRYAIMGLVNLAFVGIFTSLFKNVLFSGRIRPFNYLYYDDFHRFIYTAELNYHSSFPSGHTMTIFAAMSLMAYFVGKRWVGVIFFVVALTIGFSRIYLCQHFFIDVYVGSILGVFCTALTIWIGDGQFVLNKRSLFQKPIYKISFKRKITSF